MSFGDVIGLLIATLGFVALVAIVAELYKRRLAFHERKLEIMAGRTAERAEQSAAASAAVEARLRVLESVVTDKGYDVARRIEALRPEPLGDTRRLDA